MAAMSPLQYSRSGFLPCTIPSMQGVNSYLEKNFIYRRIDKTH